jgi:hypothetical protein
MSWCPTFKGLKKHRLGAPYAMFVQRILQGSLAASP